jgi:hypothetical protein
MPLYDRHAALSDSDFATSMFETGAVSVDPERAYRTLVTRSQLRARSVRRIAVLAGLAAAFVIACITLPIGSYAGQFLAIFEPREFVPLYVTPADRRHMRGVAAITDLGRVRWIQPMSRVRMDSARAVADAGFRPKLPPETLTGADKVDYYFLPLGLAGFSFQQSRVLAFERRSGHPLPPLPANLDGALVRVSSGPGAVIEYKRPNGQTFSIVEMGAPVITSSGASMAEIEKYMASLPGVPSGVAEQLESLANPSSMFPVPLRANKEAATTATIDGAKALVVGDQTELGSAVVWQAGGIVYTVAGSIGISEAIALANALE